MVSNLEIRESAKVLVDRYGAAAEELARARVRSWERQGAPEGASVWNRILAAVQEMLGKQRPAGEAER